MSLTKILIQLKKGKTMKTFLGIIILILATMNFVNAQIASNGNYTLTQTVIANGGASGAGASFGGNYSIEGTIGQSAAGTNQQGSNYNFKPGFWAAQRLAPTAASVSITGRILTANGRGIRNARLILTAPSGENRIVLSGTFGYFHFSEIPAGETYILSVSSKRFTFSNPTQVISVTENIEDANFVAEP
jgi:hypothetical protein